MAKLKRGRACLNKHNALPLQRFKERPSAQWAAEPWRAHAVETHLFVPLLERAWTFAELLRRTRKTPHQEALLPRREGLELLQVDSLSHAQQRLKPLPKVNRISVAAGRYVTESAAQCERLSAGSLL
jgi:hypothetical protein